MASISAAIRHVKDSGETWISEAIADEACAAAKHRWRRRVLTPVVTLRLFVLQVLWGNIACRAVTHLSMLSFTPQAYCKARASLPAEVYGQVAARLIDDARQRVADFGRWKGHRVMLIDGTGLSMPDEKALQKCFGQPGRQKPGCGFPVMHVLWVFDAATGLIIDFIEGPCHTHDMAHAAYLHASMRDGDVAVADCAFASYAHLALLLEGNLHGVFRMHQRQIVDFTPRRLPRDRRPKGQRKGAPTSRWIRSLGELDQLVEYVKPTTRPKWMTQQAYDALPPTIVVRELRYDIARDGFRTQTVTLVTTLVDAQKYTKEELTELYRTRWDVETNLCHLKQTMRMDVLRSKTVEGVRKELWMYVIVYNQVRLFMLDAAARQNVSPDRISFIDALDALRHRGPPAAATVVIVVNPHRPGRHEPRVIKRGKDRYTRMTKPREILRKALGITRVAS
jgi:hypothetical protein